MFKIGEKIFFACIIILFSSLPSYADESTLQIYLSLGGLMLNDLDTVNSRLEESGYSTVPERYFTGGGGIRYSSESIVLGLQGHRFRDEKHYVGNYRTQFSGGYGFFEAGYVLLATEGFRFYPLIGIGGGAITLSIYERDSADFGEILADPGRGSEMSNAQLLIDFSVGAEYLLRLVDSGGLIVSVQLGYLYPLYDRGWGVYDRENRYNEDVSDGPDFTFSGPHAQINLGWAFIL